ncbi:MAG: polysaccharide biosynthesis protein [Flavobacteriales bacterium]|nr:polysaccharide biosynthesis protein [Flavobacteriales bacterium]
MRAINKLAGQTAIYGLPSIIGRLLNYLLVPLHTAVFLPERFGVITEMYAYVAFLVVFLTYGMETAYFRFQSKGDYKHSNVYSTVLFSLFGSTLIFWVLSGSFSQSIANWLEYPDNQEYVIWFAFIVGLDAISSIPLARLRIEGKAMRFAAVNLSSILVNIGLNVFWVGYCMPAYESGADNLLLDWFYSPEIGVGYVFLANLFASLIKFILLSPQLAKIKMVFDTRMWRDMLIYGSPLLLSSLAIIVNENADKILLKRLLIDDLGVEGAIATVGIYGACYKLSIIISLFIQAFRYAAEPFFFAQSKDEEAPKTYAKIMNYFVITCALIFLVVMFYLDILKHFLANEEYWVGLHIVPILLLANIFLGIFYNLSVWYKLNGMTRYGALIAGFGAVITIILNLWWIPIFGYVGSAWATLICYFSMSVLSYMIGRKYYKVPYQLKKVIFYLLLALVLHLLFEYLIPDFSTAVDYGLKALIILLFAGLAWALEKPKKAIIS